MKRWHKEEKGGQLNYRVVEKFHINVDGSDTRYEERHSDG